MTWGKNYIPQEEKMAGQSSESKEGDGEKELLVKNVGKSDTTEIPPPQWRKHEAESWQKQKFHKGYRKRSENKPVMAVQETIRKDEEEYPERETWTGKDPPVRLDNLTILNDLEEKFKYLPVREGEKN